MAEATETTTRRRAIVEAAMHVFVRYGFKKTSMDDLARAAGLSRQGLYLHFPTKEALFKETLLHVVSSSRAAARAALAREGVDVEERLLDAFDAAHGHAIGELSSAHMDELLETASQLLGSVLEEMEEGMIADLARVLRGSGIAGAWKDAGISAKDLAESLYATSVGVKHRVSTRAEYRDRMRIAVRIACANRG